ncbi:hypothetical protein Ddye_030788 [Dipteronia dyeriana]|uniref:Pentatricopeptide repeat-containing protein n=1 Tax=Dipteronia dyeriana TaxID=168575 RepID=A0AAD9THA9_9ROSI|nr:hypothetical protein Ddye_030788 [Dipteronia dyeriana]
MTSLHYQIQKLSTDSSRRNAEMVYGNGGNGIVCRPNIVCYNSLIDGLCKDGLINKAEELLLEMKRMGFGPDVVSYTSLIHCLCCGSKWEEAKDLIVEMVDHRIRTGR